VTVHPDTDVSEAIKLLAKHDVSALPVISVDGNWLAFCEADLLHRAEIGTETRGRPVWLESLTGASTLAAEFAKSHGQKVSEVMTDGAVAVDEEMPLGLIAALFEKKRIKRVPVVKDGVLVGIGSRSNLIQALASAIGHSEEHHVDGDRRIRDDLLSLLAEQQWTDFGNRNVTVSGGTVHLWGLVASPEEHKALLALAESVPGVKRISDEMIQPIEG
jgi:CBS domain-containing protein